MQNRFQINTLIVIDKKYKLELDIRYLMQKNDIDIAFLNEESGKVIELIKEKYVSDSKWNYREAEA